MVKIPQFINKVTIAFLGVMVLIIMAVNGQMVAKASPVVGFVAGNIIDDYVFTKTDTMNADQIQAFLSSKVPSCDTNGAQQSEMNNAGVPDYNGNGSIQRWEWGKYKYNQVTFPCLRDYIEGGYSGAQIILNASQQYGINPQVLIVLLQKEQALVTDTWPLAVQYRSATGYGCPDTAPCDAQYYGLTNQVNKAANMFRQILNNNPGWYTPYVLGNNFIRWSPNTSCGGSTVNIENRATQSLYNYTPYQPNQSALNAGYGLGDPCGAYGNRNFYLYFTDWFGSTHVVFQSLEESRWLETKMDIKKREVSTGEETGDIIPAGTQIYFPSKIIINGTMYLRTAWDTAYSSSRGIYFDDLKLVGYTPMAVPRWMEVTNTLNKQIPRSGTLLTKVSQGTQMFFDTKVVINGLTYLRNSTDTTSGLDAAILSSDLKDFAYMPLDVSRTFTATTTSRRVDLTTKDLNSTVVTNGTEVYFDMKTVVNGRLYLRSSVDTSASNLVGVDFNTLAPIPYFRLDTPRYLKLKTNTTKVNPYTGQAVSSVFNSGMNIYFQSKIYVGGELYLRSLVDTNNDFQGVIPFSNLEPV